MLFDTFPRKGLSMNIEFNYFTSHHRVPVAINIKNTYQTPTHATKSKYLTLNWYLNSVSFVFITCNKQSIIAFTIIIITYKRKCRSIWQWMVTVNIWLIFYPRKSLVWTQSTTYSVECYHLIKILILECDLAEGVCVYVCVTDDNQRGECTKSFA